MTTYHFRAKWFAETGTWHVVTLTPGTTNVWTSQLDMGPDAGRLLAVSECARMEAQRKRELEGLRKHMREYGAHVCDVTGVK